MSDQLEKDWSELRELVNRAAQRNADTMSQLLTAWGAKPVWTPCEEPRIEGPVVTCGEWGGYWIQIARMAFNDRILLSPQMHPTGLFPGDGSYDHGWCYPAGTGWAVLALLRWNPATEAEPPNYERCATAPRLRRAGEVARGWTPTAP